MNKRLITPLLFAGIFFAAFAMYLHTLAPTFTFGDSGELISIITNLGIAHPTGFSIYILLGKVFSLLPLANEGFKINLMSALFGALTPALLFLALSVYFKKEKNRLVVDFIAAAMALLFIFSYTLWSQAVMSRIYTLNAAFCAAVLLCFFLYNESEEDPRYLFLWALLTGLGAGLHLTLTAFSGILWLHLAITKFPAVKKNFIWLLFFVSLGLSAYAYLVIRSHSETPLKWSDINTFKHFFGYITQEQYSMKKFARGINGVLAFFSYMKDVLMREMSPLAIFLFTAGVVVAFIRKFKYAVTFLLIFFSCIVMLLFYGNYTDLKLAFRYMIPSYIIMLFFIAYLFHSMYVSVKNTWAVVFIVTAFTAMMLALSFSVNYFESNKNNNYTAYNYASDLLACLPDSKAGLFATGDDNIYPLAYFKFVLNKKPNLAVYDNILTIFKDSQPLLEKSKSADTAQNVMTALSLGYTNLYTVSEIGSKIFSENPVGLVFSISEKFAEPDNRYWRMFSLKGIIQGAPIFHDFEEREVAGTYLYRMAVYYKSRAMFPVYEWLLDKAVKESYDSIPVLGAAALLYSMDPYIENYFGKAERLFLQCYGLNPENFNLVFNIGSFYGRFGRFKEAAQYFEIAGKLDPYNYSAKEYLAKSLEEYRKQMDKEEAEQELTVHFDNGRNLIKEKKLDEAMLEFEKDIKLNPSLSRSYFHIGLIFSMKGNFVKAIPNYEKSIKLDPQNTPALGNLGLVYLKMKDYKKAKHYFQLSIAIDPNQDRLKTDIAKLQRMGY
jgi:tetratricopeptide (TPR) repeat protein